MCTIELIQQPIADIIRIITASIIFTELNTASAVHSGRACKALIIFARSNTGIVISNPVQGMNVGVRLFWFVFCV
jgi:hypothetical protein